MKSATVRAVTRQTVSSPDIPSSEPGSDDLVFRLGPDIDNHQLGFGYRRRVFAAQRFDELLLEALLEGGLLFLRQAKLFGNLHLDVCHGRHLRSISESPNG